MDRIASGPHAVQCQERFDCLPPHCKARNIFGHFHLNRSAEEVTGDTCVAAPVWHSSPCWTCCAPSPGELRGRHQFLEVSAHHACPCEVGGKSEARGDCGCVGFAPGPSSSGSVKGCFPRCHTLLSLASTSPGVWHPGSRAFVPRFSWHGDECGAFLPAVASLSVVQGQTAEQQVRKTGLKPKLPPWSSFGC